MRGLLSSSPTLLRQAAAAAAPQLSRAYGRNAAACVDSTLCRSTLQVRTKKCSNQSPAIYKDVACGGNALGFYAAVRLRTSRRELHYSEDQGTGLGVSVEITENKLAPAVLNEASIDIKFGKGICRESEILEMASSVGVIIVKDECGYWINGLFLVYKAAAENFLHENAAVTDGIMRNQFFERCKERHLATPKVQYLCKLRRAVFCTTGNLFK